MGGRLLIYLYCLFPDSMYFKSLYDTLTRKLRKVLVGKLSPQEWKAHCSNILGV